VTASSTFWKKEPTTETTSFPGRPPRGRSSSSVAFGIVLIHDQDASAFELGNALIDLAEAYPGPEALQTEVLDNWL